MLTTIHPTIQNPLVLVTSNTPSFLTFTKYWVEETTLLNLQTVDTLTKQSCKLKKVNPSKHIDQSHNLENLEWSDPKPVDPKFKGITLCLYDLSLNHFDTKTLPAITTALEPAQRATYYKFATDPSFAFSIRQTRQLWFILSRISLQEENTPELKHFLSLWPNLKAFLNGQASKLPPCQEPPSAYFPNSLELAIQASNTANSTPNSTPNSTTTSNTTYRQDPKFVPCQPTQTNPALISLASPICHGTNLPKHQPSGPYHVWVALSSATSTKQQREIVWAQPLEANHKNPSKEPFALSPVKSTISLLFYDANAESPNHYQPIIKSLNAHTASAEQLQEFLTQNKSFLSPSQLLHLTQPTTSQSPQSPKSNQDIFMTTQHCKFCANEFHPANPQSLYCSPKCRMDFRAGKTFGAAPKKAKAKSNPPGEAVTQSIDSLTAKIDQLITILVNKA